MKVQIILCLLVASTFAARSQKQQALFSETLVSKLKASNLGRAVLMFGELHGKQKNVDYNRLFNALDQLGESLQARIDTENQEFVAQSTSIASDQQNYQVQVEQYQTEVAQHAVDSRDLLASRSSMEQELDNKRNEFTQTKRLNTQLENQMSIDQRNFQRQTDDINAAITVIDQAIKLLEQARNSAFVQTNQQEYKNTAEDMHKTLSNLEGQRFLYHPIAQTLVQVANGGFADQQNMQRAVRLLQTLRDSINDTRLSLQNTYENEKGQNQELSSAYSAKMDQLSNVIIPGLQGDIETKNGEIATKQSLQSDAQANLDQAQGNLNAVNTAFESRNDTHHTLISEYNQELQILGECIESLNAGGIKRQI